MKITIDVSEKNEGTNAPWWIIIDTMGITKIENFQNITPMISGPFFSREHAENYLKNNKHNYSDDAIVYCKSGFHNHKYVSAYNNAEKEIERIKMPHDRDNFYDNFSENLEAKKD